MRAQQAAFCHVHPHDGPSATAAPAAGSARVGAPTLREVPRLRLLLGVVGQPRRPAGLGRGGGGGGGTCFGCLSFVFLCLCAALPLADALLYCILLSSRIAPAHNASGAAVALRSCPCAFFRKRGGGRGRVLAAVGVQRVRGPPDRPALPQTFSPEKSCDSMQAGQQKKTSL